MIAGSAVSLAASQTATVVAMVFLATQQLGLAVAILIGLACGVVLTALQGAVIGFWAANPIVLTIAAGFAIGGMATWFSGGTAGLSDGSPPSTCSTPHRSACRSRSTSCWC